MGIMGILTDRMLLVEQYSAFSNTETINVFEELLY